MSERDDGHEDDRPAEGRPSRFAQPTPRPPQRQKPVSGQAHPGTVRRRPEDRPPRDERPQRDDRPQREDRPYRADDRPRRDDRPYGQDRPPREDRPYREDRPPRREDRPYRDDRPRDASRTDRPILTSRNADRPRRDDRPRRPDRQDRSAPPPDVVSGLHSVEALLRWQPKRVQALYLWASDARVRARLQELAQQARVRVENEPPRGLEHEAGNPQGVAVRVTPFEYADLERVLPLAGPADGSVFLCLDSITDPRNLGAILRSAAFFRVTAVILPQDRSAEVTPLVERIAEGGAASVPVVQVVNLARTLASLHDRGVDVVGTALDGATADLRTYQWAPATALVLGAEGTGIRPLVRKHCDQLVTLPGPEQMPSLNVSAFATLALALVRTARPV